jgi:hypothetical protein
MNEPSQSKAEIKLNQLRHIAAYTKKVKNSVPESQELKPNSPKKRTA